MVIFVQFAVLLLKKRFTQNRSHYCHIFLVLILTGLSCYEKNCLTLINEVFMKSFFVAIMMSSFVIGSVHLQGMEVSKEMLIEIFNKALDEKYKEIQKSQNIKTNIIIDEIRSTLKAGLETLSKEVIRKKRKKNKEIKKKEKNDTECLHKRRKKDTWCKLDNENIECHESLSLQNKRPLIKFISKVDMAEKREVIRKYPYLNVMLNTTGLLTHLDLLADEEDLSEDNDTSEQTDLDWLSDELNKPAKIDDDITENIDPLFSTEGMDLLNSIDAMLNNGTDYSGLLG